MEEEAMRRREAIRNLIRECRRVESNNKQSKVEFKKEILHYQEYMSDFREYIDFKAENPYAEKDFDFERQDTPLLKNRTDSQVNLLNDLSQ